jgi:hypothetical protein
MAIVGATGEINLICSSRDLLFGWRFFTYSSHCPHPFYLGWILRFSYKALEFMKTPARQRRAGSTLRVGLLRHRPRSNLLWLLSCSAAALLCSIGSADIDLIVELRSVLTPRASLNTVSFLSNPVFYWLSLAPRYFPYRSILLRFCRPVIGPILIYIARGSKTAVLNKSDLANRFPLLIQRTAST